MIPTVSIVIPTYTRTDKLRDCLRSIVNFTNPENVTVVVVANGASEETRIVFNEFYGTWQGDAKLLWFDEPMGYPRPVNEGIRATDSEYVVLLNDDAEFLPQPKNEWMDILLDPMLADELIGLTGPLEQLDENSGEMFLIFFCVMIRREVFNSIGMLDETFKYFGEDTDLSIRARRVGWKVVRVPEAYPTELKPLDPATTTIEAWKHDKVHTGNFGIWHDAESTIGRLADSEEVLRESRAILRERYGKKEVNTPTDGCVKCGGPTYDGVCLGAENKLNCDGVYVWRAYLVDGWLGVDEGAWLAQHAKALPKGAKILEVGSWHGRSSRFIADNLPEDGQLWCVDTWIGSSGEPEMHGSAHYDRGDHAHQWWWCNLQEHIAAGRVVPVRMHSDNAAHTIQHLIEKGQMEKFDLIFLDGDHSEEGIRTDDEAWSPLLKEGGLLCGHDYYMQNEGPYWVHVRQYVEGKYPNVEKAATSIWHTRPQTESVPQFCEPEYPEVVEQEHRTMIDKWFQDVPKDAAILDLGCGDGVAVRILREQGFKNATGLDKELTVPLSMNHFILGDMHDMQFPNETFDIIYSVHSLEHAADPLQVLHECVRVLKPEGKLFLILPYPDYIYDTHRATVHCGSIPLGLNAVDNAQTLIKTLENAGFQLLTADGGALRNESEIYLQLQKERSYVYDVFLFHNELDVLEIRLATLYDVVDRFVLVEATHTHAGEPKPLYFEENKERFAAYRDKIHHIVTDFPEFTGNVYDKAWGRERFQRDMCMSGLEGCKDDDIIIVGDADEIPNPDAIKNYQVSDGIVRLKQRMFYYYLNCENKDGWDWQKIAPYKVVKELKPCGIRYPPSTAPLVENGGWHFSFIGNAEHVSQKVQDYSHQEFNTPEITNLDHVQKCMNDGVDLYGRDLRYEFVEIDKGYPQYVQDHSLALTVKGLIKKGESGKKDVSRLHVGCGGIYLDGFLNIDISADVADLQVDVSELEFFPFGTTELILSHAFLEHVGRRERVQFLRSCYNLLTPNGIALHLGVPDFSEVAACYTEQRTGVVDWDGGSFGLENVYRYTHGNPETADIFIDQLHKDLFDGPKLFKEGKEIFPYVEVVRYRFSGEPYSLSLGIVLSKSPIDQSRVMELLAAEFMYGVEVDSVEFLLSEQPEVLQGNSIIIDKDTEIKVGAGELVPATLLEFKKPDTLARKKHWTVTAEVCTKDCYTTTLPLTLSAIINQTHKPDKLVIYDDSENRIEPEQLSQTSPFDNLLKLASDKKIEWILNTTPRKGQVTNHQHCLDSAETDFIWRVDDDEIPEGNCLEVLLYTIRDAGPHAGDWMEKVGAVGGLVHHPASVSPLPAMGVDGSLGDVARGLNLQWFQWNGSVRETQHLYSTFLYSVAAAKAAGGYPRDLSSVGHREETIFSHQLVRAGYKVLVTPYTKTYHLREATGGIRSFNDNTLWEQDEQVFQRYLRAWNIKLDETKLIVLDLGLGDHLIAKAVWPELKRRFPDKKFTLALCCPEVFSGEADVTIISIADAKLLLGNKYEDYSVYKYAWDGNFVRPMAEVMLEFFSK